MAKFPLYQWKKGQGGNVDTTNLAKTNEANTFTGKNTFNDNVEVNSGAGLLKYTTSNTTKDRQEVLVRNDLYYVRKYNGGGFTINANAYEAAEFTINGLTTGLNEFYIVMTTSNVDIGYEVKIQCNDLNYPNLSDVKTVVISNNAQNIDVGGMVQIVWMIYGNNKLRFRAKNISATNITFNALKVYHRIPAKLVNS